MADMLDDGYSFRSPRTTIWVVAADTERVRIFRLDEGADTLVELKVIRPADDTPPAMDSAGGGAVPFQRPVQPPGSWSNGPGDETAALIHGLNGYLLEACRCGLYEGLILLAPPHLLPLLVAGLSPHIRRSLMAEMESDHTPRSAAAIRSMLSV